MSIASPETREDLKEYIKIKLGAPVLQINVSDEQMDVAINDAFQWFYERQHFNATEQVYLSVRITDDLKTFFKSGTITNLTQPNTDVVEFCEQNNYISLPKSVIGVNRILRSNTNGYAWGLGAPLVGGQGGLVVGGSYGMGMLGGAGFDLTSYYTMQQYLSTMQWSLFPPISYNFNQRTHRLFINSNNFNGSNSGEFLVLECDIKADPDMFPEVYNDMFLKQLATAYVQLSWGRILTKYQQVQLPGGITMNGDQIFNEAKEEIATIKERFMLDYGDYALDIVG